MRARYLCAAIVSLLGATIALAESETNDRGIASDPPRADVMAYLDLGYAWSSTRPANHTWRSKGTTFILDRLRINNFSLAAQKGVTSTSRWGYRIGFQAGTDIDGQVPAVDAMRNAETLKHFWYTNLTLRVPTGRGLAITGGLLPGHAGYPSYYAIRNPSYTRPYSVDYVPYFFFGLRVTYPAVGAPLSGSLFVVNGYNYLAAPNDAPSYGAQATWEAAPNLTLTQNLYYGPEQAATALEFWRFMSNTVLEWHNEEFLVAGSLTAGTEKQAASVGTPRYGWVTGAIWLQWRPTTSARFALRPEFFHDPDGLQTGARQTIGAFAATAEYYLTPIDRNETSLRLEYRFDRSTGTEGGFFEGTSNRLVRDQHLVLASLLWRFDYGRRVVR